jgi:hypothetical protein
MSTRSTLLNDLYRSGRWPGNEQLLKTYINEICAEAESASVKERWKIAQDLLSLQEIPALAELPEPSYLREIFRITYQLAFPTKPNEQVDMWKDIEALSEKIQEPSDQPSVALNGTAPETFIVPKPNEMIEETKGRNFEIYKREIRKLTRKELEKLVIDLGVYTPTTADASDRDFLEIGAGEVSWNKLFKAYLRVMGRPFVLDLSSTEKA